MFYLAQRTERLFSIMKELDDLIEVMDDTASLESARLLITDYWEGEREVIDGFESKINAALK